MVSAVFLHLHEADGSAIDQHFSGLRHDGGSSVAHTDDGICSHCLRLVNHTGGGLLPRLFHHLRVGPQFTANNVLQCLSQVAEHVFGTDGAAADETLCFVSHPLKGFYCYDFHCFKN